MTPAGFLLVVSTTAASLGVPVEVTVTDTPQASYALDLARSTTDTFAILKAQPGRLELLPLAVGPLEVKLFWKVEGQEKPTASPPLVLSVAEPALDSPELADIKPPLRARPRLWPWLLAAALACAAYLFWRKRRRGSPEAGSPAAEPRPPHELALDRLASLEALWSEGRRREFYFALTDVLREYFEPRFEIQATSQTTSELVKALKDLGLERGFITRARAVLERADLVKFADVKPDAGWGLEDLQSARACVAQTAPPPPKAPEAAQA